MRLRNYVFPARGTVENPAEAAAVMKDHLNKGPESVFCRLFSAHSHIKEKDTVDRLQFVMDEDKLVGVRVSTYDWLLKNFKNEIRECVQMAADAACRETGSKMTVTGNMKYEGTDENLPKHFYHLTERKSLDDILENGITPKRGHNDWKSKKRCAYLTEDAYIVPWLGILDNLEDPVVVEIETDKLPFVEQGRIWEDRRYVPGIIYSEHRTTEVIPPEALRVMEPEEIAALGVNEKAVEQLMIMSDPSNSRSVLISSEAKEVILCMDRLREMGVMDEKTYTDAMNAYTERTEAMESADFANEISKLDADAVPFMEA